MTVEKTLFGGWRYPSFVQPTPGFCAAYSIKLIVEGICKKIISQLL
jgi:hypothetical protein